jgi:hypothetical protein
MCYESCSSMKLLAILSTSKTFATSSRTRGFNFHERRESLLASETKHVQRNTHLRSCLRTLAEMNTVRAP